MSFDPNRISVSTLPFLALNLDAALADMAALGVRRVDLLGRAPHFTLDSDPAAVLATAKRHGIAIAHLASYLGNDVVDESAEKRSAAVSEIRRGVDIAVALGARTARVFRYKSPADNPEFIARMAPHLREAADYALSRGVRLGIENHGGPLSGNPHNCQRLVDAVGSQGFGVIYDPCNLYVGGVDPLAALDLLAGRIVHVHLKDAVIESGQRRYTMLGEGAVPTKAILGRLKADGYTGDIMLEYEATSPDVRVGLPEWFVRFEQLAV